MSSTSPIPLVHFHGPVPGPVRGQPVFWRLIISKRRNLYLYRLQLTCADTRKVIILKLSNKLASERTFWQKLVPFLEPVIYVAELSSTNQLDFDLEAQNLPMIVDIDSQHYSNILTNDIQHPHHHQPASTNDLLVSYRCFAVQDANAMPGARYALMVKYRMRRIGFAIIITWSIILGVLPGVAVGLYKKDLWRGVEIAGAFLAIIAILDGFLFWAVQ